MRELTATYLDYAEANINPTDYGHCNVIVQDFLGTVDTNQHGCLGKQQGKMGSFSRIKTAQFALPEQ